MISFIHTTNNFEEITVMKRSLKTERGIIANLEGIANRMFGTWEHRPDNSKELSNVLGFYIVSEDGQTLEARYTRS